MTAISISNALAKKYNVLEFSGEWYDAFWTPQTSGVWFVWGNSGSGKSNFMLQLCKEICRTIRKVHKNAKGAYMSLEEGIDMTFQEGLKRAGMESAKKYMKIIYNETIDDLSNRFETETNLKFVVIDSFQYTGLTYPQYEAFRDKHKDRLIIFVSQAEGKQPSGRTARRVKYDASLKIWVEGHRAFSNGRYKGPTGIYTIWEEGAAIYHGLN